MPTSVISGEDFGLKIYNKFPPRYREDDIDQNFALKRYLLTTGDGYKSAIEDIYGLTNLINPDKIKAEHLPILLRHYGLEVFNGIPEQYLRYILPILSEAYSIKGSLQSVDYICSSLSGIKTSTDVEYDDTDNPLVKAKLEMDYNLGSYVPEVSQLSRVLKNFIPFYCDLLIIYSYVFYESQTLNIKEYHLSKIKDIKNEKGLIIWGKGERYFPMTTESISTSLLNSSFITNHVVYYDLDADYTLDKLKHTISESGSLDETEVITNNLSMLPVMDSTLARGEESRTEVISVLYKEDAMNVLGAESGEEYLVTRYEEQGTIDARKSHEYFTDVLNRDSALLNEDFVINEGVDVDALVQENHRTYDIGGITSEEKEVEVITFVEGVDEVSNFGEEDLETQTLKIVQSEVSSIDKDLEVSTMFLNMSCTLNSMLLSSIPCYDKITVGGVDTYYYPTQFGYVTA